MDKSPQRIERLFDSIAPWYDFLNHFLSLGIDRSWRRFTAKKLLNADIVNGDVLDICCGTGDLTFALIKQYQRCRNGERSFYGIDFSEEMVNRAGKKAVKRSIIPSFSKGDALHLPFEDNRFAVVTNAFGLRNVSDTHEGLKEMVRVCKPGGLVGVLDFSMPTLPVLRQLYRFYFTVVLPRLGNWFAKNDDAAYRYLPESVLAFDSPQQLAERMRQLGLTDIHIQPLTFGIAALVYGKT
ncbi:demethylmenaquinone methyltransferase [Planctomycetales bacterium]|nr:demethylmenaquinone methyltransferase [Planctomycetales bacterium]